MQRDKSQHNIVSAKNKPLFRPKNQENVFEKPNEVSLVYTKFE